jgi:hypothetical protein
MVYIFLVSSTIFYGSKIVIGLISKLKIYL